MGNFEGKVALVTGAAHGIGKGIAEKFAAAGANTVIVDYNPETGTKTAEEITNKYVKSLFVQADVSDPAALTEAREKVFKEFGRIDFLVLNAGVAFANKVNDISFEEWNKTLSINLTGLFNTVKAFYNDFLDNQGSIVYISSGSALSGTGGGVSYPASKAGGEGL
ncbi:MAG: SDR family NAD(P)-dependent oxidoreductase, partial [Enterococcus faecalis]|nr:SDR family NAD(P)-dependent oxidoreductase [Enterococcus faecalis]